MKGGEHNIKVRWRRTKDKEGSSFSRYYYYYYDLIIIIMRTRAVEQDTHHVGSECVTLESTTDN